MQAKKKRPARYRRRRKLQLWKKLYRSACATTASWFGQRNSTQACQPSSWRFLVVTALSCLEVERAAKSSSTRKKSRSLKKRNVQQRKKKNLRHNWNRKTRRMMKRTHGERDGQHRAAKRADLLQIPCTTCKFENLVLSLLQQFISRI